MPEESLFDLLLNAAPAERAAILDRETADRPDVRDRLLSLLAAADRRAVGRRDEVDRQLGRDEIHARG